MTLTRHDTQYRLCLLTCINIALQVSKGEEKTGKTHKIKICCNRPNGLHIRSPFLPVLAACAGYLSCCGLLKLEVLQLVERNPSDAYVRSRL